MLLDRHAAELHEAAAQHRRASILASGATPSTVLSNVASSLPWGCRARNSSGCWSARRPLSSATIEASVSATATSSDRPAPSDSDHRAGEPAGRAEIADRQRQFRPSRPRRLRAPARSRRLPSPRNTREDHHQAEAEEDRDPLGIRRQQSRSRQSRRAPAPSRR